MVTGRSTGGWKSYRKKPRSYGWPPDLYLEGYGRYKLEDAFAAVNIKGRHGANMGGNSIVDLICNEKIVGDMLLQKTFVVDPITKEVRKNNGEKPQYFVEGSHEGILDRETYEKVLAERARRAAAYKPRSGSYERNHFPFSGKIHCGKCGKSFTRKVLNGNTPYEKRGWLCRTFNQKGKAHCDAKQIPEEILKRVSAEAMGLPEFDEAAFAAKVEEIQVPENGVLVFVFYDGHTVTKTWDNPSRRHSWNPENRQRARELRSGRPQKGGLPNASSNSGAGNGYPRKERPASHQCTEQRGPQATGGSLCPCIHQQRGAAYQL